MIKTQNSFQSNNFNNNNQFEEVKSNNQQVGLQNENKSIAEQNKEKNREKYLFFKFLMYNSKIEINFESFMGNIYWISLLEGSIWILQWALFLSSPSSLAVVWFFLPHLARAIVGFIILRNLPNTFQVIENLRDYENQSLDDIQNQMLNNFKGLLANNEAKLQPWLISYFVLTIIDLIIDIVMFFVLLNMWGRNGYEFTNVIILASVIIFYVCDLIYFDWMGSLKYSFPEEMLKPIRQAVVGFLGQLKEKVVNGFGRAINRIRSSTSNNNNQPSVAQQQSPQEVANQRN